MLGLAHRGRGRRAGGLAAPDRSDADEIENLGGWLTTVVARVVCLNMLRSRTTRREEPLEEVHVPDPLIDRADGVDPEHQALLADSVGLALLVVLETLSPAERLAFVLHDMFAVPFDEIAPMVDRSPTAARQLASRARRRVQGAAPAPDPDLRASAASSTRSSPPPATATSKRLVAVLHPDVVLRADGGRRPERTHVIRGAENVAAPRVTLRSPLAVRPARARQRRAPASSSRRRAAPFSVMGFTVVDGRIVAIDALADPERVRNIDLTVLD